MLPIRFMRPMRWITLAFSLIAVQRPCMLKRILRRNRQPPGAANAAANEKQQDCTISGMVVAMAGSVPLKNALVTLHSVDDRSRAEVTIRSEVGRPFPISRNHSRAISASRCAKQLCHAGIRAAHRDGARIDTHSARRAGNERSAVPPDSFGDDCRAHRGRRRRTDFVGACDGASLFLLERQAHVQACCE